MRNSQSKTVVGVSTRWVTPKEGASGRWVAVPRCPPLGGDAQTLAARLDNLFRANARLPTSVRAKAKRGVAVCDDGEVSR